MSLIEIIMWGSAIIIGAGITWAVARHYYLKSASKEEIQDLREINKKSTESTALLIQKKTVEIKDENLLNANVQLENLINLQFNRFLETKQLDKDLLIKELRGNTIETLLIIKQKEGDEQKFLRERIKLLGFKHVTFGDWILPPRKLKDKSVLREEGGVRRWVESNLIRDIQADNFVNSVVIVNLSNIYDEEKGEVKKVRKIIGGVLKPADFIPTEKLLSEIHKRDKISLKEIIQIPFLDVLISQDHPKISEEIKKNNHEIVKKIEHKLNLNNLVITDLENLTEKDLGGILKEIGIKSYKLSSKEILENAKILINYFNKNIKLIRDLSDRLVKQTPKKDGVQ